jgi:hypothetical protein
MTATPDSPVSPRPNCRTANHRAGSSEPARRRRARSAPRARCPFDRTPPTSSCVRRSRRREPACVIVTATPNSGGVITPELAPRQPPRRLLRASSTTASALSAASALSFRSHAADLVVRAPISPSAIRVRHRDRHAEFRWRHRARAAAPPITAPAPLSQLDDAERAQRCTHHRERRHEVRSSSGEEAHRAASHHIPHWGDGHPRLPLASRPSHSSPREEALSALVIGRGGTY